MREKISKDSVFVCIGTNKHSLDSFGPVVGSLLEGSGLTVYGTLDAPIHALNCKDIIPTIKDRHPSCFIIAIDAALCNSDEKIDKILFRRTPIRPGKGVGKDLPEIGDMSLVWYIGRTSDRDDLLYTNDNIIENVRKTVSMAHKAHNKILRIIEKNEN